MDKGIIKHTLQEIKDLAYKNDVLINDDKSVSITLETSKSNFIIKQFYPIDWLYYTDDKKYRIEFIAKKNNLTFDEYVSILEKEKKRVSVFFEKTEGSIEKAKQLDPKLNKLREIAKLNNYEKEQ